eukprot:3241290-Rhodomonas_salina.1
MLRSLRLWLPARVLRPDPRVSPENESDLNKFRLDLRPNRPIRRMIQLRGRALTSGDALAACTMVVGGGPAPCHVPSDMDPRLTETTALTVARLDSEVVVWLVVVYDPSICHPQLSSAPKYLV